MAPDAQARPSPFGSAHEHGFVRIATAVPPIHLVDPLANVAPTVELARAAHDAGAALVVFPELGLVGYSSQDLFHQQALVEAATEALGQVRDASRDLRPVLVVGLPLRVGSQLFNVAAVVHRGRLLGLVPKSYLPNYREFYEKRHFSAARQGTATQVSLLGEDVPFGTDLLFAAEDVPDLVLAVEICEDLWAAIPPSSYATLAGATVVVNPSGSDLTVGKAGYRRELVASQSARTFSAYAYAGCGPGESTTDLVWDGHALIAEDGVILAEGERFVLDGTLLHADIDLDRLVADRVRTTSWADAVEDHRAQLSWRRVAFHVGPPSAPLELDRHVERFPFVPSNAAERDERCAEVYAIQREGLRKRLSATGIEKVVLGVSGGLDSTQALLVAVRCMDELGLPRTNVLGWSMPGFATSEHTRANAHRLMRALGVTAGEVDIRPAAQQMLHDLGHPAAEGAPVYDLTYENVQAGARTSLLFRLANQHGALVLGTGDLSELALGWATYGVGDHMSHYGVNSSVPKTLVQHLVRWVAEQEAHDPEVSGVLASILGTEISPELIPPGEDDEGGRPHQRSEDTIGPYELQDFFLYHVLRFGYRPTKVAFLAHHAWGDATAGRWPGHLAEEDRHAYDPAAITRWLRVFLHRFFQTSQFKRSALPDGPKVGSGGSLSPRGDWRAPSDASSRVWLDELDRLGRGTPG